MTIIGITILNAFYKILHYRTSTGGRCHLLDRDVAILKKIYDFEDDVFADPQDLEEMFDLPAKRIHGIYCYALKKIAKFGIRQRETSSAGLIRRTIDLKAKDGKKNVFEAIIAIGVEDLAEFPCDIVIRLLSRLYFLDGKDRREVFEYYHKWKRDQGKEERIRSREEWAKVKEVRLTKANELRFDEVLQTVIWFNKVNTSEKSPFDGQDPKRKVNKKEEYHSGIFWSNKCQRNVQYESSKELNFIKLLEINPKVDHYLDQPVTIDYRRHGVSRTYTPDFAIHLVTGQCILAEVKDLPEMTFSVTHRKMEALIDYCECHGFGFLLTNGKYSINRLWQFEHNNEFEAALKERLYEEGAGTLYFFEYNDIRKKFDVKYMDLMSIVIKNGWSYYPSIFRLKKENPYTIFRKKVIMVLK